MNSDFQKLINLAKDTFDTESGAILGLKKNLNSDFAKSVELIYDCTGRLVVTGIGKSALIGQKIVGTFNSTGTSSMFLHAADAIHGDIGMLKPEDVILCLSKSGNTPEIKVLIPLIKRIGCDIIAISAMEKSYLGENANFLCNVSIDKEACPNNLAPTASTTAQLAMGDALAMAVLHLRGFGSEDFAKLHPGGSLGKKLYLKVSDLLSTEPPPTVNINSSIQEIIVEITSKRKGATAVVENEDTVGIITDGDLRRMLERKPKLDQIKAQEIMTANPISIQANAMAVDALHLMENKKINQLIIKQDKKILGIIHLHDLLKEGLV